MSGAQAHRARAPPVHGRQAQIFTPEMRLTLRRISGPYKEANIIDEHRQVKGSHQISIRAADLLEDMRPQHYNGANRAEAVRTINDILQGRTERTVDGFLTGLRNTGGEDYAQRVEEISRDIQAFLAQKALLSQPYTKSSSKQYKYRSFDLDPERPLKIVNQRLYDQAAKAGFPPDFFRETFFNNVTFYCMPDHTDFNFSRFSNCTFAVCRIREATFDGTSFSSSAFHTCTAVSQADALPGDLALYPDASHVGMVVGRNEAGKLLVCHCSSG